MISSDTLKSLGYLKKSLKMSRRAIEKNMATDGTVLTEVQVLQGLMDAVTARISIWESLLPAVAPVAPSVISTSTAGDGSDLLT